jgi:hypothetical protein
MNCDEVQKLIGSYIDRSLSGLKLEAFIAHIQRCPRCRELLQQRSLAHSALQRAANSSLPVPEHLTDSIKQALRRAEEDERIRTTGQRPAIGSPAFIATCASLIIGAIMIYILTTQVYMQQLSSSADTEYSRPITTELEFSSSDADGGTVSMDGMVAPARESKEASASASRTINRDASDTKGTLSDLEREVPPNAATGTPPDTHATPPETPERPGEDSTGRP